MGGVQLIGNFCFPNFVHFLKKNSTSQLHHYCSMYGGEREIQRVTRQRKACLVVYQHHQHDLNFFYSQQRSKHLVIWFLKPMESAGTWDATQGTTSDVI